MSAEFDIPNAEPEYWVAIQPSPKVAPNVFGPYIRSVASSNRKEWLRTYPESVRGSAVFRASSREQAEKNVQLYIPTK